MSDPIHIPIQGLVMEEVDKELNKMVTRLYIIMEIEGIPEPYLFDVTNDVKLRNLICANLPDEVRGN